MSLPTSSRPQYEKCSLRSCGRDVLHKDYVAVLAEAGVDPTRLADDLLLDEESCCTRAILSSVPAADPEFQERLDAIKAVRLSHPPPFNVSYPGEELRPTFHKARTGSKVTDFFLGAEPYYYLVERGENPTTVLKHLQIDPRDWDSILAVTDRPENDGECPHCGEHIPHYKFLSHLYRKNDADVLIPKADRVEDACCRDFVINTKLTEEERGRAEALVQHVESRFSGIPVDMEAPEACVSCGSEDTKYYDSYDWLVHHGVPTTVALNYFGLHRLCCRASIMNPIIRPRESKKVTIRRLNQEAAMPAEVKVDYDYEANRLPTLSGRV